MGRTRGGIMRVSARATAGGGMGRSRGMAAMARPSPAAPTSALMAPTPSLTGRHDPAGGLAPYLVSTPCTSSSRRAPATPFSSEDGITDVVALSLGAAGGHAMRASVGRMG